MAKVTAETAEENRLGGKVREMKANVRFSGTAEPPNVRLNGVICPENVRLSGCISSRHAPRRVPDWGQTAPEKFTN
jgi:hypothetical protein